MKITIRHIGGIIVMISLIMVFSLVWFIETLSSMSQKSCTCGDICEMVEFQVPIIYYIGLGGVCILLFLGIFLSVKSDSIAKKDPKNEWLRNLEGLDEDEKAAYKLIINANGALFQSELVEKTKMSKVKISRLLDKLESRQLLERRRRGLTNMIVLK